ncbi:hypothetical protein GGX14DRAFT_394558 [Mycena pura]|uniref:Uncharacterized protein n=1 Tax=Mycena pura TaxID=153505 RepID=A0AAD6VF67_9AGAR|nr:hypothetical protein GGX14DRAFT_394558 [Mycena pura]
MGRMKSGVPRFAAISHMPTKSPSSPPHAVALVSGFWTLDGARDTAARLGMRWPGARRRGRDAVWAVAAGQRRRCRAQPVHKAHPRALLAATPGVFLSSSSISLQNRRHARLIARTCEVA